MDPENLSFHDFHRRGNKRRMLACNRSSAFHFSNVAGRKYRSESLDRTDFLCLEHCGSIHLRWHLYCQCMTKLKCQMIFTLGAAVAKIPVTIACATLLPDWISVVIAHTIILIPLMITQNVSLSRQLRSTHQSSIPS